MYVNEAGHLLNEGADPVFIDRLAESFGLPMGPFALSDEVGLDVGLKVLHILRKELGERYETPVLFEKMCEAGWLGRKTNVGFYLHDGGKRRPNPDIDRFRPPKPRAAFDAKRCLDRMILTMINEAARALDEGVAPDADTVDAGMVFGTGFPPFRGGLLAYADTLGADVIVDRLELLAKEVSPARFAVADRLKRMAADGARFVPTPDNVENPS